MNQTTLNTVNGVNLDQLVGTIEVIKNDPEVALFRFRSTTEWINGGHSKTTIQDFYGAKQEDTSRTKPFELHGDEPAVLLGENHGPNAVEAILHALASCLSVGIVYNASAQGIEINALSFSMEGQLDLQGFLGLSEEVRPGYSQIGVKVKIDANASDEQLQSLFDYVQKTSPVLDIIQNPVPVSFKFV
jgi:uncharacterized OsmC-like protein